MPVLDAIFRPPQLLRFLTRFGLRAAELETTFTGWHKRVVLAPDRVFLFPRYEEDVELVEREAIALEAVADVDVAPRLHALHRDEEISPYPFLEIERRTGVCYEDIDDSLDLAQVRAILPSLGAAVASWHTIDPSGIGPPIDSLPSWEEPLTFTREVIDEWWTKLSSFLPDDLVPPKAATDVWCATLLPLNDLDHVLTHGDVHEDQILLDDDLQVSTVLDWDHAGVAHPLRDFNFHEWGYGIFRHEASFDQLYESFWDGYRAALGLDLPDHRPVLLHRALHDAAWLTDKLREQPWSWFHAQRMRFCLNHISSCT